MKIAIEASLEQLQKLGRVLCAFAEEQPSNMKIGERSGLILEIDDDPAIYSGAPSYDALCFSALAETENQEECKTP